MNVKESLPEQKDNLLGVWRTCFSTGCREKKPKMANAIDFRRTSLPPTGQSNYSLTNVWQWRQNIVFKKICSTKRKKVYNRQSDIDVERTCLETPREKRCTRNKKKELEEKEKCAAETPNNDTTRKNQGRQAWPNAPFCVKKIRGLTLNPNLDVWENSTRINTVHMSALIERRSCWTIGVWNLLFICGTGWRRRLIAFGLIWEKIKSRPPVGGMTCKKKEKKSARPLSTLGGAAIPSNPSQSFVLAVIKKKKNKKVKKIELRWKPRQQRSFTN